MSKVCGNCGNTQGPFARLWIGFRKTGQWIFICPEPKGKGVTPEKIAEVSKACTARREKANAAAPESNQGQG